MRATLISLLALVSVQTAYADGISKRTLNTLTKLPYGWSYQGCYSDSNCNRKLAGTSFADAKGMTAERCVKHCAGQGYLYAGLEFGTECFCGDTLGAEAAVMREEECASSCSGNRSQRCGGRDRLTVYIGNNAGPVTNPGIGPSKLLGCYSDNVSARALSIRQNIPAGNSKMSVAACISSCSAAGFPYAGVEYSDECYCDTAIRNYAAPMRSGCNMVCAGNSTEFCGGAARINIYQNPELVLTKSVIPEGWSSQGCYTDRVSARTLRNRQNIPGGDDAMNVASCLNACKASGYSLAGVEYGSECYCDNKIRKRASRARKQCNMPCKGNPADKCGDADRINLYSYDD